MYKKEYSLLFLLVLSGIFFLSCQKEIDGSLAPGFTPPNTVKLKPRLGTTWTYRYYTYYSYGALQSSSVLTYKAKSEDSIAGEKWLNVVDVNKDTTVFLLNEKTGSLYIYANSASNLFLKDSSPVNTTYSSFFEGGPVNMIVKGMNDTLPTGVGDVPANYYEGYRGGTLFDQVWYNKYFWILRKVKYRKIPITGIYYRYSSLFIESIVY